MRGNICHNIASLYSLTVLNIPFSWIQIKIMSRCAAGRACYILRYFFFIMIPPYCVCSRLLHQSVVDKASWAAKWAKSSSVYIAVRPNWTLTMADFATFTQTIFFHHLKDQENSELVNGSSRQHVNREARCFQCMIGTNHVKCHLIFT